MKQDSEMRSGRRPWAMVRTLLVAFAGLPGLLLAVPGAAQSSGSRPVVQPMPDPASKELADALRALAANPRSVPSLIAAGNASLKLEDLDAAEGFFARAQVLEPQRGAVKAGMASVLARRGLALPALKLFEEADIAGGATALYAADRGLAYDLAGDNVRAQRHYHEALAAGPDPLVSRRLAISLAIVGDQRSADAALLPMLQAQDLAAYRARAFALAILGKSDEAVTIAETLLPPRISGRIAPYLRYMPRLTRSQQAAAANLGKFPRAAEIGRDDPALATYAAGGGQVAARTATRSADSRLEPAGEPLGPRAAPAPAASAASGSVQAAAGPSVAAQAPAPPEPPAPPTREVARPSFVMIPAEEPQQAAAPQPLPPPLPQPQPQPPVIAPSRPVEVARSEVPRPSFSVVPATQVQQQAVPAVPAPPVVPATAPPVVPVPAPAPVPAPVTLAEAFADLARDQAWPGPAAGAVDITKITPVREDRRPPAPPPPPPEPSKIWVQVATGRDAAALRFDWRRIRRDAGSLLDDARPFIAPWGQTNRLVTGPYPDNAKANAAVRALKDAGIDSFRFNSAEGEHVKPLG